MMQSDQIQLLKHAMLPLTSNRVLVEVISRWTFIYEYLCQKSTNQKALRLWCNNTSMWNTC